MSSLRGVADDLYGMIQLTQPAYGTSYTLGASGLDLDCSVPEPAAIDASYVTGSQDLTAYASRGLACPAASGCTTQSPIPSTSACLAAHTP